MTRSTGPAIVQRVQSVHAKQASAAQVNRLAQRQVTGSSRKDGSNRNCHRSSLTTTYFIKHNFTFTLTMLLVFRIRILLLGVLTSVPILVKIDQEMRPWECTQTDTQIHWRTQTGFVICPMLNSLDYSFSSLSHLSHYSQALNSVIYADVPLRIYSLIHPMNHTRKFGTKKLETLLYHMHKVFWYLELLRRGSPVCRTDGQTVSS